MTAPVRRGKWLLRKPAADATARLFCFPYSGLGASMYSRWPQRAGGLELCAVQPPGRENRICEPHYGGYPELAAGAAEALAPYLDRPFGFFGHCGGALAAFATALHLHLAGGPAPTALFVSSQVAPHEGPFGRFLSMSDEELRAELAALTEAMGGTADPDMIEFGLGVLRADLAANQDYRLDVPIALPTAVCAIGWRADTEIRPEQMPGWRDYAARLHEAVVLDGGHHAFLGAPAELLAVFDRVLTGHAAPR